MAGDVWTILRREYKQRVKSKAFVLATLGIPLMMIGMMALSVFFAMMAVGDDENRNLIAVVDSSGVLADDLSPRLARIGYSTVDIPLDPPSEVTSALAAADTGTYTGVLIIGSVGPETGSALFHTAEVPSGLRRAAIEGAVVLAALGERGSGSGFGSLAVTVSTTESDDAVAVDEAEAREAVGLGLGFGGGFVLYMAILIYGSAVLRATLEEKQSRIVEVIVASVRPTHLMLGKILGVGSAGLTQLAIWVGSLLAAVALGVGLVQGFLPEEVSQILATFGGQLPGVSILALFLGYFLFGYFIFAGLFAAVGAMCGSEQEAQYATMPVVMLMVAQIMILMPIIQAPNSTLALWASLFPMFSPVLMWARVAAGAAAGWEIALSFALMGMALVGCAWVAGRIYRIGILSTGKRPSIRELARWVIRG